MDKGDERQNDRRQRRPTHGQSEDVPILTHTIDDGKAPATIPDNGDLCHSNYRDDNQDEIVELPDDGAPNLGGQASSSRLVCDPFT